MADAGFIVYNDKNTPQIDSVFYNLAFMGKGVWPVGTTEGQASPSLQMLVVTGTDPVVAIRCNEPIRVCRLKIDANTYNFQFIRMPYWNLYDQPAPIEYYIFDRPTSSSNFGMQVFDPAGQLVFDAGRPYMRVVDQISGSAIFDGYERLSTYSYSVKTAAICCQLAQEMVDGDYGNARALEYYYTLPYYVGLGNTLTLRTGLFYAYWGMNSAYGYYTINPYSYLIVDVTGY